MTEPLESLPSFPESGGPDCWVGKQEVAGGRLSEEVETHEARMDARSERRRVDLLRRGWRCLGSPRSLDRDAILGINGRTMRRGPLEDVLRLLSRSGLIQWPNWSSYVSCSPDVKMAMTGSWRGRKQAWIRISMLDALWALEALAALGEPP